MLRETMPLHGFVPQRTLIDACLDSLIDELLQLWHVGVRTYNNVMDHAFIMRTAMMWTVNDLPAYGMASRWSTANIMGHPTYISSTVEQPLTLPSGYSSNHKSTKKTIFCDLPYWPVIDTKEKTKDNLNAGKDLKIICNRSELELDKRRPNAMPKAVYTITKEQKRRICEWICVLKFRDRYASNIACYVDMTELRMYGMKSHDCQVHAEINPDYLP
ncbi:UNVERIFIED_CONTAM: hypothetical protein Sindi_2297300 [Sesamum indicum]